MSRRNIAGVAFITSGMFIVFGVEAYTHGLWLTIKSGLLILTVASLIAIGVYLLLFQKD